MQRIIPFFLIVPTSLLFFVEFENENNFFKYSQLSPALCGPEFIDQSILPKKLKSLNIFRKKKKCKFFPGSFSIFQLFKWSQHCYLFVKLEEKEEKNSKISLAIPRPSPSGIHQLIIFTKKIEVSGYFQKERKSDKFKWGYPSW